MGKINFIFALGAVLACMVIYRPEWISENKFIKELTDPDAIAILGVLLSVMTASTAGVLTSVTRFIKQNHSDNENAREAGEELKTEIKNDMNIMFFGFLGSFAVLFFIGFEPENIFVKSGLMAFQVWIILLLFMCMYDIYRTACGVAEL